MKSPSIFLTIVACTGFLPGAIHAGSAAEKSGSAGYELKNRSSFKSGADARIAFWPIGWQRPAVKSGGANVPVNDTPAIQLQAGNFNLTSVLLGNPALATINGRSFAEGEALPVIWGTQRLRVIVRSIRDGGVWLDYEGQQTFVPMRRTELPARRTQPSAEASEFAIRISPN